MIKCIILTLVLFESMGKLQSQNTRRGVPYYELTMLGKMEQPLNYSERYLNNILYNPKAYLTSHETIFYLVDGTASLNLYSHLEFHHPRPIHDNVLYKQ